MRAFSLLPFAFAAALPIVLTGQGAKAQSSANPVQAPCAACHLPTGAGVPGAFPPIRASVPAFAQSAGGRKYLVLAIARGLSGPITVEGRRYAGVMPAQSLSDAQIAAALNRLLSGKQKAFTASEIASIRKAGIALSPAQIARLRPTGA